MLNTNQRKLSTTPQLGEHPDVNRNIVVRLLVTEAERKSWQAAADAAGLKLSEWIRRRVQGETVIAVPVAPAPTMPAAKAKKGGR